MPDPAADILETVQDRDRFKGRISLESIKDCMDAFGHPEQTFPAIHIAGTNGKGSTATIISAILRRAGYDVGTYTQPHLVDLRERVRVNGVHVPRERVRAVHEQVEEHGLDLSFFEFTTALAFEHFSREQVDIAVVETGMGGRLDATNVLSDKLAVITNIAEDHTNFLGESRGEIAREKAGIIPDGGTVVSGASGTAQDTIAAVAADRDATLHPVDVGVDRGSSDDRTLTLDVDGTRIDTRLIGDYQVDNVNTALAAITHCGHVDVDEEQVRAGLERVTVPGRMEVVDAAPLTVLDGAHNPAGMRRAVETFARIAQGNIVAVVSVMGDKDHDEILAALDEVADTIICSRARMDRAADPDALAAHVDGAVVAAEIPDAIDTARARAGAHDTIIYTGSLYFVGNVKEALQD